MQIICQRIPDRRTGLWQWKHIPAHVLRTVCGVALSVHFGRQIADVSKKLHRLQLMYKIQKDTGDQRHASSDKPLHLQFVGLVCMSLSPTHKYRLTSAPYQCNMMSTYQTIHKFRQFYSNLTRKSQPWSSAVTLVWRSKSHMPPHRRYPSQIGRGADLAAWLPGTCQVGRLVRRPGGPPRRCWNWSNNLPR